MVLERLTEADKAAIAEVRKNFGEVAEDMVSGSYALVIDHGEYNTALRRRLEKEDGALPANVHLALDAGSLVKQVAISLAIAGRIGCAFSHDIMFAREKRGHRHSYRLCGCAVLGTVRVSNFMRMALYEERCQLRRAEVTTLTNQFDRYFRSGRWWTDRVAMALHYFWTALCTPYPDQSFLSMMTMLEALLLSQTSELGHSLAERVAILCGKDARTRIATYRTMKRLYKVRSKLVHGSAAARKGRLDINQLFVTAKLTNVPPKELKALTDIAIQVLRAVLRERALLRVIQTKKNDQRVAEIIDEFFAERLFR